MHITAFKRIGRLLLKTSGKGISLKPTLELTIECYVDADIARLWNKEDHNDENLLKAELDMCYALANAPFFG